MLKLTPLRIIAVYVVLSIAWITSSDLLIGTLATNTRAYTVISIIKGWLYIFVTASILYGLIRGYAAARDRAERSLLESEEKYRTLVEAADDAILLTDLQGKHLFANSAYYSGLGYPPGDDRNARGYDAVHPDDVETVKSTMDELLSRGVATSEYRMRHADGHWVHRYAKSTVIRDKNGKPVSILAIIRDTTKRKRAEEALRESQERFKELADSLPESVFECDTRGLLTYVNSTGLRAFGYTQTDIDAGLNVLQIIAPQGRQRAREAMERRLRGDRFGYSEYTALRRDNTMFPMGVHSAPITRGGKPVGLRGLAIDMSEHKLIEAEMQKAQKLESLGILAGGIAHDFNNILTAILGNIALTRMRLKPDSFEQLRLEEAEKASLHAKDLTLQLLTFSKGGEPVKKAVAIDRVIRDAVSFALRGARVKSSLHFDAGLWPIAADAGQMGQVFQNLVLNACQAMPAGGVIGIEARNAEVDSLGGLPVLRGRYVQVTVRDEGAGIPEEHLSKIFDPFFTTKHAGSGLGLAVTYSIIKSHGGHISVRSRPGEGTTFTVLLPASELLCESSQKTAVVAFQRKGSILIMDDEDMVRDVAGAIIREFGYEVAFARDGREAILLYTAAAKAGKPFDAVIMDLTIPGGMGGMETVQELRQTDPAVKAVASSGYSNDPVLANYGDYGFSAVITKPYTPAELGEVLQKLLDTYNTE